MVNVNVEECKVFLGNARLRPVPEHARSRVGTRKRDEDKTGAGAWFVNCSIRVQKSLFSRRFFGIVGLVQQACFALREHG